MAVLKCTVCGGELDVNPDLSVGKCQYCGSIITIPKELDRKGNLYNRAVFLRQNNEFDKAAAAYEDILKEDNSDADAHWGLVLSKFGIEYVSDPRTRERIPTCHRTQAESILSDPDYLAALEHSYGDAKDVIKKDARRINDIQARIIEISQKEPPYDIFICYKESDDLGNRTEDSILAQDLYFELTKRGYQVFFARKTLESRLGSEYEPIIYAALSSAKVMIVLGTKPEHFNAVWVRNEWSRFSKMAQKDTKVIIPAYRGMSPYELPAELSVFQSQDMSKIGFMQDLTDGIERHLRNKKKIGPTPDAEPGSAPSSSLMPLERLIKNGETYLKLDNYPSAEEVYTRITKEYPEDYHGWWGLMVCKTCNFSKIVLDQSQLNVWFRYVKQLADRKEFTSLEKTYLDYTYKISQLVAEEDMKEVGAQIDECKKSIENTKSQINITRKAIESRTQTFQAQEEKDNKEIEIEKAKGSGIKGLVVVCIVWALLGVGIVVAGVNGVGEHPFLGVFVALPLGSLLVLTGIIFFFSEKGNCSTDIEKLKQLENEKLVHKTHFNDDITRYNSQIGRQEKEIHSSQSKRQDCQRYLSLGKEKIAAYWFAQKCAAFGVSQPVDPQILEYRNAAFAPATGAEEMDKDTMVIVCPACGAEITAGRDEALSAGQIICANCGSLIDIEGAAGQTVPDSPPPGGPACWVCSACGWAYESADRPEYCPVCGASGDGLQRSSTLDNAVRAQDGPGTAPGTGFSDKWSCSVCGYIHEGATPPSLCPACHVPGGTFEKINR